MSALALSMIRGIPITVIALILQFFYYEGAPGLREIPFIDHVPLVRDFTVGRVELERRSAAAEATKDLVSKSELAAQHAINLELERQLEITKRSAEAAAAQAARMTAARDKAQAELEKRIADDVDPADSRWTDHDIERYGRVRGRN